MDWKPPSRITCCRMLEPTCSRTAQPRRRSPAAARRGACGFLGWRWGKTLGKSRENRKKKRVKTLDKSEKTRNNSEETRENRGKTEKPWIYGNELETDHKHTGKQHGKPDNSDSCENRGWKIRWKKENKRNETLGTTLKQWSNARYPTHSSARATFSSFPSFPQLSSRAGCLQFQCSRSQGPSWGVGELRGGNHEVLRFRCPPCSADRVCLKLGDKALIMAIWVGMMNEQWMVDWGTQVSDNRRWWL